MQRSRTNIFAYNRIFKQLSLLIVLFFYMPLPGKAQDSIPKPPGFVPNRDIGKLKHALDRINNDANTTQSLLETARGLNYLPGQVVALCNLAGIYDGQKDDESKKDLQEAQQLSGQIKELSDAGWALGEVGRLRGRYADKSAEFKTGLSGVFKSLSLAMTSNAFRQHDRKPPKPADADDDDDDDNSWSN